MIISHKYRFIHLRAAKVGSTSVEQTLSCVCGEEDVIVTALHHSAREDEDVYTDRARNGNGFEPHMRPSAVREKVGEDVWSAYLRVVGVRNPWDMLCSYYEWESRSWIPGHTKESFGQWAKRVLIHGTPQVGIPNKGYWLDEEGEPTADVILRRENLEEDFARLCVRVGLPETKLMRLKTKVRGESNWRVYYNDDAELIDLVAKVYGAEIKYFGYKY